MKKRQKKRKRMSEKLEEIEQLDREQEYRIFYKKVNVIRSNSKEQGKLIDIHKKKCIRKIGKVVTVNKNHETITKKTREEYVRENN